MESITNNMRYQIDIDKLNSQRLINRIVYNHGLLYNVFNYDKEMLCYNDDKNRTHRMTILSYPENNVLAFSSPKSLTYNTFTTKYPMMNDSIIVTEYIEGIMVNLFYDNRSEVWKLATLDNINIIIVDGNDNIMCDFKRAFQLDVNKPLNDIIVFQYLPKEYSYTFALKPVITNLYKRVERPEVYIISVYQINVDVVNYISPNEYENWTIFTNVNNIIKIPSRYDNFQQYSEITKSNSYDFSNEKIAGVVIKNVGTGEECKILMDNFEKYMKMKYVMPLNRYKYICLNRINRVTEFLTFFPQLKGDFYIMKDIYNQFIRNIRNAYVDKYIKQNNHFIPDKYVSIIYKLHHTVYLQSLNRKHNIVINCNIIKDYMKKMDPKLVLELLHNI
jgi:hypothetical protein